jgi:hypothetical protein
MNEPRLMVVMGEMGWTLAAMHLACAISRCGEASVMLLKMVPVRHPLLLGTEAGFLEFTAEDGQALAEMAATAEDYGVPLDVQLFQYVDYWPGVVDAAGQLGATAVIVHSPSSPIPYWQEFRRRWLRRRLASQGQSLFALDSLTPSLAWRPSITLQNDMARMLEQHQS